MQALKLRRDSLQMLNSAICGTPTTELWNLLEGNFGVNEDPEDTELAEAQSLASALLTSTEDDDVSTVTKESIESEEITSQPSTSGVK